MAREDSFIKVSEEPKSVKRIKWLLAHFLDYKIF